MRNSWFLVILLVEIQAQNGTFANFTVKIKVEEGLGQQTNDWGLIFARNRFSFVNALYSDKVCTILSACWAWSINHFWGALFADGMPTRYQSSKFSLIRSLFHADAAFISTYFSVTFGLQLDAKFFIKNCCSQCKICTLPSIWLPSIHYFHQSAFPFELSESCSHTRHRI